MLKDQIRSIRETIGRDYERPDPSKVDFYTNALTKNQEALDYLHTVRGFNEETIGHFKLGYSEQYNAISIPVYKDGQLINIKYRFLEPKDIRYTSEKGAETWLFNEEGISEGTKAGTVLVVEGELDAISAYQAGIKNVVSTASGKDSYGVWVGLLDPIKNVYIAFDNDKGGKESSRKMAERVGQNKCREITYPEGIKDANDYFKEYSLDDFKKLAKQAKPYYSYEFKNVGDIINGIRNGEEKTIESQWIPSVKIEKDWLIVLSGDTNVGKTSYAMNVAKDFSEQGIPTLVMPFERGISSVGKRFLQVFFEMSAEDMAFTSKDDWDKMLDNVVDTPVYFSVPKTNEIEDTIRKSVRYFGVKVVIIDHLDYIIRHTNGNRENEIANTLQNYKRLAEELSIVLIVVTHLRKRDSEGRPTLQDLKGSSSLSQDPECVILLSTKEEGVVTVDVAKNKGIMKRSDYGINLTTGVLDHSPEDY